MARPREFDPDDALENAMQVFWTLGYEDASLPELLEGMGLTRGSLYKAFKDKKSLFLNVMDRYDAREVDNAVAHLGNPDVEDGWERITTLFRSITSAVAQGDRRGCLLCSAAAGPARYDTDIAKSVQNGLDRMQGAFKTALQATDSDPALADLLLTQYVGLRIQARANQSETNLIASIEGIDRLKAVKRKT
jgi:TetR/AcrR family transcriptional repressor of nem operon